LFNFFENIVFRKGVLIFYRYDEIYGGLCMFSSKQKLLVLISVSVVLLGYQLDASYELYDDLNRISDGPSPAKRVNERKEEADRVKMRQRTVEEESFRSLHKNILPSPRRLLVGRRATETETTPRSDVASPKSSRPLSFHAIDATRVRAGAERGRYQKQQIANVNAQAAREAQEAKLMTDNLHERQGLEDTQEMQRTVMMDGFNKQLEALRAKQLFEQQREQESNGQDDDARDRVDDSDVQAWLKDLKTSHQLSPEEQEAADVVEKILFEDQARKREPIDDEGTEEHSLTEADIDNLIQGRYYSPQERAELEKFIAQVVAKSESQADVEHDDTDSIQFDHDSDKDSIAYHEEKDQDLTGFDENDAERSMTSTVLRHVGDEINQLQEDEHALTESPSSAQTDDEELQRKSKAQNDLNKVERLQVTLDHMNPTTPEEKREISLQQRALTLLSVGLKVAVVGGLAYGLYKGYLDSATAGKMNTYGDSVKLDVGKKVVQEGLKFNTHYPW